MTKWLTTSGLIAAILLALSIWYCLGIAYLTYPIVFLTLGSLLSKLNKGIIEHDDSSGRNAWQVLANGGVGLVLVWWYYFIKDPSIILGYIVSFSVANSDTFSSEIGRYFKGKTIDIITLKKVNLGMSGGISRQGTLAGVFGSLVISTIGLSLGHLDVRGMWMVAAFGFVGMLIDSIFGSRLQGKYLVETQIRETGTKLQLIKGISWMDNNLVNFVSIAATTILFFLIIT